MTASASTVPPPPRLRLLRIGLDILIVLLLLVALLCGILYWLVRAPQPELDGALRLGGLAAPVTVVRDSRGIPHITAQNIHDLYFAQGFTMAQDRLWQMDLLRRLGEGRLSEVFGPAALDADRTNRELGLGRTAAAEATRLQPQEQFLLQAFSAGVNAYIADPGHHWPLEFHLLHYSPEPWQPRDTLALAAYMFQVLGSGYQDKLTRETFTAKLGPALAQDIFPDHSPWDEVPGVPGPPLPARRPGFARGRGGGAALAVFPAPLVPPPMRRGGSNNWALSGAHSFNGKPILANDPHLQFQIPGLWWTVQLTAPGLNVAGAAIAGVPGVIIGHNDHIAWGVTNTHADVQDLYRETLDGKGNVRTAAGWRPLQHWRDTIAVKGEPGVPVDIWVTPHGPIVAHDAGGPLALDWSLYAAGALQSTHVFLQLDQAQNYAQFRAALAAFPGPAQNFVYADAEGHIAYQCAGWVPLRQGFDGSLPVPGDNPAYAWQGWIPFAQLPGVLDPSSGVLATANQRVTPNNYPHTITTVWDAPNRARRIYEILGQLPRWNASAMGRVQQDVVSEQDADFAAALVAAGNAERQRGQHLEATLERALALLRGFRGAMGHTSLGPTLAYQTRQEFLRRVLAAKVGDALARQYDWSEAPVFEQMLLATRPPRWLPPDYAARGWDALLLNCLAAVATRYTLQPRALHWGQFETLQVDHPVFSHLPWLRNYADLGPVEINGSPLTVKQARNTALGDPNDLGPSLRFVADLGDWDRSTLTLVAGESGLLFNPHYRDQWPDYLRGIAVPLWFSPQAVSAHQQHRLQLLPRPASQP